MSIEPPNTSQCLISLRATAKRQSKYFSRFAVARSAKGHWLVQLQAGLYWFIQCGKGEAVHCVAGVPCIPCIVCTVLTRSKKWVKVKPTVFVCS
jgi:hypothetical protein